ncbi:Protein transport protein Sec31A, partial [Clarias magur]
MDGNTNSRPHDLYLKVNPVWIQEKAVSCWTRTREASHPCCLLIACPPTEPIQYDI